MSGSLVAMITLMSVRVCKRPRGKGDFTVPFDGDAVLYLLLNQP